MRDVLVVGAGPAGTIAAIVAARAGARVCLIDRATFPRRKLCGDTLNPGALAALRRLDLAAVAERVGAPVEGMLVTGGSGVRIEGRYPNGLLGRCIGRTELDAALVHEAIAAGVEFIDRTAVRRPIVETGRGPGTIVGVAIGGGAEARELRAPVTIAADGRHSTLAFALHLVGHPPRPRRWAIGAYAQAVPEASAFGEMHIRPGRYIGVASLPGGVTNVCLVRTGRSVDRALQDPMRTLRAELAADRVLRDRFADARWLGPPMVLGPLAVDPIPRAKPPDGLLLAGDAAGFIDPMTGDGLRFAIRGGVLAADAAIHALTHGFVGIHDTLVAARQREFAAKWRFNRALRRIVASHTAVRAATIGARALPGLVRAIMARASDCDLVSDLAPMAAQPEHSRSHA